MIEPSLQVNDDEFKPLSQLNKAETEQLLNQLNRKYDMARNLPTASIANQILNFISIVEERLEYFDSGHLIDVPKETGKRIVSITEGDPDDDDDDYF